MKNILGFPIRSLFFNLVAYIVTTGWISPAAAMELPVYHLRSDKEKIFTIGDKQASSFWSDTEWSNRSVFTVECKRILPSGTSDGVVTISAKAVATRTAVYMIFNFEYDHPAPTSTSLEVPLDAFFLALSRYAYGLSSANFYHYMLANLTPDSGSIQFGYQNAGGGSSSSGCTEICGEVIEGDSQHKSIEIMISCEAAYFNPPRAGACKAIELRYFAGRQATGNVFVPADSLEIAGRVFLGELTMEPHFDDSVYVITSPNAGISLRSGALHTITWGTTVYGGIVELDYSSDNGITWHTIIEGTLNDGAHAWEVPRMYSDGCLIRLKVGTSVYGVSEKFTTGCPAPQLLEVQDSTSGPILSWQGIDGVVAYRILIDTQPSFEYPLLDDTLSATRSLPDLPVHDGKFYWKVAGEPDYTCFSTVNSFVFLENRAGQTPHHHFFRKPLDTFRITGNSLVCNLTVPGVLTVELLSINGQQVCLLHNGYHSRGNHTITLSALRNFINNGTYILRCATSNRSEVLNLMYIE